MITFFPDPYPDELLYSVFTVEAMMPACPAIPDPDPSRIARRIPSTWFGAKNEEK